MTTTSAERQQAYRAKRPFAGDNGERRLQSWVSTATALALGRLARRVRGIEASCVALIEDNGGRIRRLTRADLAH